MRQSSKSDTVYARDRDGLSFTPTARLGAFGRATLKAAFQNSQSCLGSWALGIRMIGPFGLGDSRFKGFDMRNLLHSHALA